MITVSDEAVSDFIRCFPCTPRRTLLEMTVLIDMLSELDNKVDHDLETITNFLASHSLFQKLSDKNRKSCEEFFESGARHLQAALRELDNHYDPHLLVDVACAKLLYLCKRIE